MALSGVADLTGRTLAGRYRLLAPIGVGASGRVYAADDVRLRRKVAVKVLHAALADDEQFLRRFRAEAQLAASLHHPNVMAVYDWGEEDLPFMVLELLDGGSLRSILDAGVRLTPSQAAHVGREVCDALEYAHARGLVHRDIKPANLLFDEHGIVRVADFGLARALAEASITEPTGAVIGTARYAAPEQAAGVTVDGRADLYALAVVLIEAVSGQAPLVGETPIGTLALRSQRNLVAPPELGALGPVTERAGQAEPDHRYPDADTMRRAIRDAMAALPPPGPLTLVGAAYSVDDEHPTEVGTVRGARLFDQDADEIEVVPAPRRPRRRLWLSAGIAALAAAVAFAVIVAFAAVPSTGSVAVPNLVGERAEVAQEVATRTGFGLRLVEASATDPAGTVLEQIPSAGSLVEDGRIIELTVSSGPAPVGVPEVVSLAEAEAAAALDAAGFVVRVERRNDESVPANAVVGTEPGAGAQVAPETMVTLVISDGPAPVSVPDVAGATFDDASAQLGALRFEVARDEAFSDSIAPGLVVRTDPEAGALAARDSTVTVFVSLGPELVDVPSVVGSTVEAASAALQDRGLDVEVKGFTPGGTVRAQDPTSGRVRKGATVTLFL